MEARRLHAEAQGRMSLAWHGAAFTRAKKMPSLASLLGMDRLTPADMDVARADHAALLDEMGDE